jgi:hypothetical protein
MHDMRLLVANRPMGEVVEPLGANCTLLATTLMVVITTGSFFAEHCFHVRLLNVRVLVALELRDLCVPTT